MKNKIIKKVLIGLGIALGVILLSLAGLILYLTISEYRPAPVQPAERIDLADSAACDETTLTIYSWNIGYAGLGKDSDLFMDGGTMVDPPSQEIVEENLAAIAGFIATHDADAWLLQEVDVNSARTGYIDELSVLSDAYGGSFAFAYNYKCPFVPIPIPPIGRVESGIATLTRLQMDENAERIALPCPFSWPVSTANLKRCLLVTRLPLDGSDKEIVLVNLHLEAYSDSAGRHAQTKLLLDFLQKEYEKGNYVIAGGDFNQTFPGVLDTLPVHGDVWAPEVMEQSALREGWQYAFDPTAATCRLLNAPYHEGSQLYILDGFIVSPNVRIDLVETVRLDFEHSDHDPVRLCITLLPD